MSVDYIHILFVTKAFDCRVDGLVVFSPYAQVNICLLGSSEDVKDSGAVFQEVLNLVSSLVGSNLEADVCNLVAEQLKVQASLYDNQFFV